MREAVEGEKHPFEALVEIERGGVAEEWGDACAYAGGLIGEACVESLEHGGLALDCDDGAPGLGHRDGDAPGARAVLERATVTAGEADVEANVVGAIVEEEVVDAGRGVQGECGHRWGFRGTYTPIGKSGAVGACVAVVDPMNGVTSATGVQFHISDGLRGSRLRIDITVLAGAKRWDEHWRRTRSCRSGSCKG